MSGQFSLQHFGSSNNHTTCSFFCFLFYQVFSLFIEVRFCNFRRCWNFLQNLILYLFWGAGLFQVLVQWCNASSNLNNYQSDNGGRYLNLSLYLVLQLRYFWCCYTKNRLAAAVLMGQDCLSEHFHIGWWYDHVLFIFFSIFE